MRVEPLFVFKALLSDFKFSFTRSQTNSCNAQISYIPPKKDQRIEIHFKPLSEDGRTTLTKESKIVLYILIPNRAKVWGKLNPILLVT